MECDSHNGSDADDVCKHLCSIDDKLYRIANALEKIAEGKNVPL